MGFFAIVNAYTMRMVLNIAIVEMVVKKNNSGPVEDGYCYYEGDEGSSEKTGGDYEWSEKLQGIILSAFYYGYVITHVLHSSPIEVF